MINFERIKVLNELIKKDNEKLKTETQFPKKEILKLKISINLPKSFPSKTAGVLCVTIEVSKKLFDISFAHR
jgi:hypothetical protein